MVVGTVRAWQRRVSDGLNRIMHIFFLFLLRDVIWHALYCLISSQEGRRDGRGRAWVPCPAFVSLMGVLPFSLKMFFEFWTML